MPNIINENNIHYVKFMRGSEDAWTTLLTTPERVSNDTLYFIYENEQSSTEGKLYLGTKLISGTGNDSSIVNINDIGDIYIDDTTLADKQILVYNETTERWENASLSQIISTAVGVMSGATANTAGASGLVPAPQAGDQAKFLKGSGQWTTINLPTFDNNIFTTAANNKITLIDFSSAAAGTVPIKTLSGGIEWAPIGAGHISRQIISMSDLEDLLENETAQENIIYMVPLDNPEDAENQYEEYMIISGDLEKIGTIGDVDLTNYVTTSAFATAVGNLNNVLYGTIENGEPVPGLISKFNFLETKVGNLNNLILSTGNTTLVEEINTINGNISSLSSRLQWQEINNN